ncbi:histone-lysine N-methyltransferase SETMAR [Trichonephila clavata]|uniref:Histone-lysine N-methyltransferase SETMAR n=1 Tax=Trichonephila clavata TaxID=2740835 RepID=A0A8X6M0I8_TRICU|nr:histone-lysine N-methyltransferase SETMAR [Trichonephila clavata]
MSIIENIDKITEIIEVDQHISSRSITQKLNIDHMTVLNHLHIPGFDMNLNVWVPHQLNRENMIDQISICEALAKQNKIDTFL